MGAICVQGQLGNINSKAASLFSSFSFNSLSTINGVDIGCSASGIYLLNNNGTEPLERSFTLATTDLGYQQYKRIRYLYIGIRIDRSFTVLVSVDELPAVEYLVSVYKEGLQRIRIPLKREQQGRYWQIQLKITSKFSFDQMQAHVLVLSSGFGGI